MLPKIEAAIEFLTANPEGSVLITSLSSVEDALKGKSGTLITAK
jgi:carbamate kinase